MTVRCEVNCLVIRLRRCNPLQNLAIFNKDVGRGGDNGATTLQGLRIYRVAYQPEDTQVINVRGVSVHQLVRCDAQQPIVIRS